VTGSPVEYLLVQFVFASFDVLSIIWVVFSLGEVLVVPTGRDILQEIAVLPAYRVLVALIRSYLGVQIEVLEGLLSSNPTRLSS